MQMLPIQRRLIDPPIDLQNSRLHPIPVHPFYPCELTKGYITLSLELLIGHIGDRAINIDVQGSVANYHK